MALKKNLSLIIAGPTGVGKTDFSISLAKQLNTEIINIDVGQFYEPLSIGTAKPDWQNESIPHRFFDIINQPEDFTVIDYREAVKNHLEKIWNPNKLPIFVGGSGFYIQSLLFPPQAKKGFVNGAPELDSKDLWENLYDIDPIRALQINKNDYYRLSRALEIWKTTGIKPSEYKPVYDPISDFILIILVRDRQELYEIINKRVINMLNRGWINEVKGLNEEWKLFLQRKKIIGYDDIINYLNTEFDNDEDLLIDIIQKKVRNYAKRQITFFKALSKKIIKSELETRDPVCAKKIIWVNISHVELDLCVQNILKSINSLNG